MADVEWPVRVCTVCGLVYGINREASYVATRADGMQWFECDEQNDPQHVHPDGAPVERTTLPQWFLGVQALIEKRAAERVAEALIDRARPSSWKCLACSAINYDMAASSCDNCMRFRARPRESR